LGHIIFLSSYHRKSIRWQWYFCLHKETVIYYNVTFSRFREIIVAVGKQ